MTTTKARIEARILPDSYALIKRAAELQGRTVTDFVTSVSLKFAQEVINEAEVMRLSVADQASFANALINPPPANAALKKAFARKKQIINDQL
ncbi:DUF1778 domain-containing protein [Undibacterium pigrum]|uniref:Uncharacterized protein (DUF1778 family) n=1 Tax=Undibacterium pigrum TaxID=401470 RepID=A0A318IIT4_9BURK|nr:DUF1778 domain-containing protein [Undibacterium pigrum]PXX33929.1 uncharacterized protein (DUF1778 family) [Undibacterium pigrum]